MRPLYIKYIKKVAVLWAICFAVFAIVYLVLLMPVSKKAKAAEKIYNDKKQVRDMIAEANRNGGEKWLKSQIEYMKNGWMDYVIDKDDLPSLKLELGELARENNIKLTSRKTTSAAGGDPLAGCEYICEMKIDVKFTSSFNNFASFVSAIERKRPVVFIDYVNIIRSAANDNEHNITLTLSTFIRK